MNRLSISDEVRDTSSIGVIERAIAQREHTELICIECGGAVAPESPEPASVVVGFDDQGTLIERFAHDRCAPSHVDRAAPWTMSTEPRLTYVPILRPGPPGRGPRLERNAVVLDSKGTDATAIAAYRSGGFVASDDGIETMDSPILKDSVGGVDLVDTALRLHRDERSVMDDALLSPDENLLGGSPGCVHRPLGPCGRRSRPSSAPPGLAERQSRPTDRPTDRPTNRPTYRPKGPRLSHSVWAQTPCLCPNPR
jgi:hypothetical protein